jgi:hypothetical protein
MKISTIPFFYLLAVFSGHIISAQTTDSTQTTTHFYGSVGITTNGFSIIPSFSLNSPAVIVNLAWRRKRFSFEPDVRLVPDATKGGMLLWLRYRLVDQKRFNLRVGAHPAINLLRRTVQDNGVSTEITEMLRFGAFEVAPNYQLTKHWSIGAMYLEGHRLQASGPQTARVLFLNTGWSNLPIGGDYQFHFFPTVFFLNMDGFRGSYLSATAVLSKKDFPFTLQGTVNQTFQADIPGNQPFMWNVTLNYQFSKYYRTIPPLR